MQTKSDLQTVLQFTSDDLNDNREGRLSAGQIERLQSQVRASRTNYIRQAAIVAVIAIVVGVGIANVSPLSLSIVGIVIFLSILILIYVLFRSQRSLSVGKVQTEHGKVTTYSPHRNKSQAPHYFVKVGTVNFEVSHEIFQAFHKGRTYTIYYVNLFSETIVAAEEIA